MKRSLKGGASQRLLGIVGSTHPTRRLVPEAVQIVVGGVVPDFLAWEREPGGKTLRCAADTLVVACGADRSCENALGS